MNKKLEFHIKLKYFSWKDYLLTIGEKELQLQKESKKKKAKKNKIQKYSLVNAVVLDKSEKSDLKILVTSPLFRLQMKIMNLEDKKIILSTLEEIIKKNSAKTAFSKDYLKHLQDISTHEDKNHFEELLTKLNTYKILMDEVNIQLLKFKTAIKEKLSGSLTGEFLSIHNDMETINLEMKRQFNKIHKSIKKHFIVNNDKAISGSDSDTSSSSEDKKNNNININSNTSNNIIKKSKNNQPYFLNSELLDYYNPNYDFRERVKMKKNIKCPDNMIKEIINIYTKKLSSPVYFNEPLSMGQKQCEKFFYLDLLKKASKQIKDKPLQMCYISAFIIGEIFLNIGRFLKPFSPILGETYEYFENHNKFRYYSEQVKHKPLITAFVGEAPEFAIYGDTLSENSFKFLKGIELSFKNPINIYLKTCGSHYVYNRPTICVKGLMKPPMYNDYSGTTIIQDVDDENVKCELTFIEQSWTNNKIGDIEGKSYSCNGKVKYLIGGNWQEEIYITDPDGNNKQVLLSLSKNTYLGNTTEKYTLPFYSCNLNFINEDLKKSLPKNDSRFRQDMRIMEKGEEFINEAQKYKNSYEEKQRKELKDEGHQILFFIEKKNEETEEVYYVPNGEYWEMKKDGRLKDNIHKDIFEVDEYLKNEEEKEKEKKEREEKEKKEREEKEKKEKEEKEKKEKEEKEKKEKEEKEEIEEKEEKKIEKIEEDKEKEEKEDKEKEEKAEKEEKEEKKERKIEKIKEDKEKEEKKIEKIEEDKDKEKEKENKNENEKDEAKDIKVENDKIHVEEKSVKKEEKNEEKSMNKEEKIEENKEKRIGEI